MSPCESKNSRLVFFGCHFVAPTDFSAALRLPCCFASMAMPRAAWIQTLAKVGSSPHTRTSAHVITIVTMYVCVHSTVWRLCIYIYMYTLHRYLNMNDTAVREYVVCTARLRDVAGSLLSVLWDELPASGVFPHDKASCGTFSCCTASSGSAWA